VTNGDSADLLDLRASCRLVDSFVAEHIGGTTLSVGDRAERAIGSVVSSNYFEALGVRPMLGRTFRPSEDTGRNAHPVTVISYQAWKERYHRDADIVGRIQMLNGMKYTIIWVMPERFTGTFVGYSLQFWVPASMEETFQGGGYKLDNRGARWSEGFAFLKPGVTMEQAQAEISAISARLAAAYPATNRDRGIRLYPLWQTPFNNAGTLFPTLRISVVVACMVLLIACANVANLLLVKSFARRHEMSRALAAPETTPDRRPDTLHRRSRGRTGGGALVPEPHRAAVPAHARRCHRKPSRRDRPPGSGCE
jgi:MacB-like periplasmic core domain